MEQKIKARIVLAHADAKTDNSKKALPNELILYDFNKKIGNSDRTEIRLRIGDGTTSISDLPDLPLGNMHYYDSKPTTPEVGDIWYNEAEKTFYLGTGNPIYEKIKITRQEYQPNIYYKWLADEEKYVLDSSTDWVAGQTYYILKDSIKLSYVIEYIEEGLGEKSIQTTGGSQAYSNYSVALGEYNISGAKAFSLNQEYIYTDEDIAQKRYYLNSTENIVVGDKFSIVLKDNYDFLGKITGVSTTNTGNKYVTVDTYEIPNANVANQISINSYLLIPNKPTIGDKVIGTGAYTEGSSNKALGSNAHAEGYNTLAAGKYSHAEGKNTKAGYASHAEGSGTTAKFSAHAEGGSTIAQGEYSHAEGLSTTANGHSSHAEGQNTVSSETASHAEGYSTKANGKYTHAEGVSTIASEMAAHAEGNTTEANGKFSHAEGSATKANGENSHAEGTTTTASGINSHAEGNGTTASGNAAHTEGQGTIASGDQAHAEGYKSQASYQAAHAEGYVTTATKIGAHAEGSSTEATGDGAHAEGYDTIASGPYSHAEGSGTTAVSFVTHAEGQGTIARGNAQHVQGKYNIDDTNKKYAHIVGNGTSEQRSNAHTLDWDGNAWYAGDIIAGTEDNQKDIIATRTLKGNSLDAITGEFNTINVGGEIKASIDKNGNIISPSITTSNGNFENITVKKEDNNIINLNGETGEINTLGSIQAQGTGHFDNGLTVGGKHYGSNNYENPVLNYRGVVTNLTEITDAKPGDIVCIENLIEQKLIEFKVPKKEDGYIGDSFYEESTHLYTNQFIEFQATSPYGKIVAFLLDDNKTYNITKEEWENSDAITHSNNELNEFKISFTFSDNNKTSIFIPSSSLRRRTAVGYEDPDYDIDKKAFYDYYSVKGNLFYDGQLQDEFHNHDVIIKYVEIEKDMPPFENVPEELKKYAIAEPQETSNYYLYDGKEWNDLTYNGKQLQSLISSHCMPTIGYSNNSKYKVSVGGENIVDLLKQAFNEGESVVYIESGKYTSSKQYVLPQGNFTIIGLGDVNFNFVIYDNPTIKNKFIYTFNNITFSNILYFDYITDDKDGAYYYNSLKANNCQFNSVISIWPEGEFNRCIFSNSIESSSSHYTVAIFNQCEFYNISRIAGQSFIDCKFYYLNSEIEKIFFGGKYYQESFNFQNCIFQLNNKNIKCCCNIDNNDEAQQLLNNKEIKNSSFLQYPFTNIECIDEETCYINSNVNYEDKDLHYKGIIDSEAFNKIVEKTEGDLYNVEEDVYKNGVGSIYYKITPQDQNYSDAITCIGEYNNYNDYRITGVTGGFANIITDLYNISEGITQLTDKIQINLYSEIFDETLIIPYEAHLYYNDLPDNKVQTMYELCFHYYGYDRANKPIDWFSSSIQGYFITSSSLNYATKDYEKIHHTEKIDSREKIGVTNSLKVYKEDDWENLIKGIPLNYKGQLEKYSYLPENKNIGDLYSVLSTTKNIYNRDQSGTFLGYNSLVIGQGDITFTNNGSDNNTFILTLSENTELRKILCHYVGAYDFGTKNYKSINLSFNNYKGIELIYSQSPEYNYFKIYKVEYNGDKNEIKIEGEVSAYETTYPPYTFAKGETMSIRFSNSATLINDYLNKSIYINSYPSGKWFWDGIEWVFFDQKEIVTDQIQYSTRDIEKNSNLKTGTLYIVYEEDDE